METFKRSDGAIACAECHNSPDIHDRLGFHQIWHSQNERSCIGCHEAAYRSGNKQAALDCTTGCHATDEGGNGTQEAQE
jgi:hypothetical protein